MISQIQILKFDPRGRAIFCAYLARKLPPLPSDIQAEMGELSAAMVSFVLHALELTVNDDSIVPGELSVGLRAITGIAQRKADEVEKRLYRAGDNYGFSGAADTYSEIYRYLGAHMRTVASAAELDVEQCIAAFRTALKLYGMYSVDGDPKGAIRLAIEEAEETAATVLADAYASVPEAFRQWKGELSPPTSAQPGIQREPTSSESAPATHGKVRHQL